MLDFICMGITELCGTGSKREIQYENSWIQRDSKMTFMRSNRCIEIYNCGFINMSFYTWCKKEKKNLKEYVHFPCICRSLLRKWRCTHVNVEHLLTFVTNDTAPCVGIPPFMILLATCRDSETMEDGGPVLIDTPRVVKCIVISSRVIFQQLIAKASK